jgi:ABC-type oligopeptide transport system ATPase subunit
MNKGKVVELANDELYLHPQQPYTQTCCKRYRAAASSAY